MANTAAFLVDRVLPDVSLRQYVLTLPYELRKLVAFKADVLTATARIFVESVFAVHRARAQRAGIHDARCGAVNFVQRFGSLNLHCHYHLLVLDGVFARDAQGASCSIRRRRRHPPTSTRSSSARRAERSCGCAATAAWTTRRSKLARTNRPRRPRSDACAAIAMGRGTVATLPRHAAEQDDAHGEPDDRPDKPALAVERDGFNLHADVRIEAGDDLGRERLARYGARTAAVARAAAPPARWAHRLPPQVRRSRQARQAPRDDGLEFMARLAAIICPPRYPLTRFAGVLSPRSKWRREVVPRPREKRDRYEVARDDGEPDSTARAKPDGGKGGEGAVGRAQRAANSERIERGDEPALASALVSIAPPPRGDVLPLAPNIVSAKHWDRLLGGLLYATSPRVDWATLLRRSFAVDVLECPKCHARLRVVAVITEREPIQRILAHLGLPTDAPTVSRARDPTDDAPDKESSAQLARSASRRRAGARRKLRAPWTVWAAG